MDTNGNVIHNVITSQEAFERWLTETNALGGPMHLHSVEAMWEGWQARGVLLTIDAVPEDSHLKSLPQRTGSSVRLNARTRELSIEQPNGGDASFEVLPEGYVLIVSVPEQP